MVDIRKELESIKKDVELMYIDRCNVISYEKYEDKNGITRYGEILKYENLPCHLTYSNVSQANSNGKYAITSQVVKLYLAPDVGIKTGSIIEILGDGKSFRYKCSGKPILTPSHQEIILEIEEGRA